MKSPLPFFFKRTFILFEVVALCIIVLIIFFLYTHFYKTSTEQPTENDAQLPTQQQSINIPLYQKIVTQHQQKQDQATQYEGHLVNSPIQELPAGNQTNTENLDTEGN